MATESGSGRWPDDYLTTVRRLNARWDLCLPESLVVDRTINLDEPDQFLQRECAKGIYFLSRNPLYRLTGLLEDFAQLAEVPYSQWVPKRSQEKGTLPVC